MSAGATTRPTTYEIEGRTIEMPCVVRDATAATAMFDVDAEVARGMVPAEFDLVETAPGRCQLALAVIDYRDNDLGDYLEVGVTFFVTPTGVEDVEAGTYITHLPVDQRFTCAAGRTIWGFPKTVDEISFERDGASATCTLKMDGLLVLRLTLPAGGDDEMPPMPMATYTIIEGRPYATAFTQGGTGARVQVGGDGVSLELGDHPLARSLALLGLPATAEMATWTEHMQGSFDTPVALA